MDSVVIDPVVNVANAWTADVESTRRARDELFDATADFSRDIPAAEMIQLLDRHGIDLAIVPIDPEHPHPWLLDYPESYPDRFVFAAEPRLKHGVNALWALEDLCRTHPVVAVRLAPMFIGERADHAIYHPMYVKCVELDIPVCLTTGIPGPPLIRADLQHPMTLDSVLLRYPELTMVMLHGADPWWDEAIRLLRRHENLYMCTSAWAPGRLPESILRYLRGSGRSKVMFSTDYPVLGFDRALREARELGLDADVLERFVGGTASKVFLGDRSPRHIVHAGSASRSGLDRGEVPDVD